MPKHLVTHFLHYRHSKFGWILGCSILLGQSGWLWTLIILFLERVKHQSSFNNEHIFAKRWRKISFVQNRPKYKDWGLFDERKLFFCTHLWMKMFTLSVSLLKWEHISDLHFLCFRMHLHLARMYFWTEGDARCMLSNIWAAATCAASHLNPSEIIFTQMHTMHTITLFTEMNTVHTSTL